jgi:hypothetical protein
MRLTVCGITSNQKIDIPTGLLSAAIRAHDLDPELGVDVFGLRSDDTVDGLTLRTGYAGIQIIIQREADLLTLTEIERIVLAGQIRNGPRAALI